MVLVGGKPLRILILNCDGIGKRAKRVELIELLRKLIIGVCVLTETHLRDSEVEQIGFKYSAITHIWCRKDVKRIGGGMMILAHHIFKACNFECIALDTIAIEHCAIRVYISRDPTATLLIAGV